MCIGDDAESVIFCLVWAQTSGALAKTNLPSTLAFKSEMCFIESTKKESVVQVEANSDSKLMFLVDICF